MTGLFRIGLSILISDTQKFFALVIGITIAVFLMVQATSIFTGDMRALASYIINMGPKIWVMNPSIDTQTDAIPLPYSLLNRVRSVPGVLYAAPLSISLGLVQLSNGKYQITQIVGLDDASLMGSPKIIAGKIDDIYKTNAYVGIQDPGYGKLNNPEIGTRLVVNGQPGIIVAKGKELVRGILDWPTLYTTYARATSLVPPFVKVLSFILVEPKPNADITLIKNQVKEMGYLALTQKEFLAKNESYYIYKTGYGTNIWILKFFSLVVGVAVATQMFYMFILENLMQFSALKAMGAKNSELTIIIIFQSITVSILSFGIGILLSSLTTAYGEYFIENYIAFVTPEILISSFLMIVTIIMITSWLGIQKVTQIDPFNLFRS